MFNLNQEKLKLEAPLHKGRFGLVYPYCRGPKNSKWVVEVIKAVTNKELPEIIEQIVIGFSCDHPDAMPVEGFYMEPADRIYKKVSKWNVYIKLPRQQEGWGGNRHRSKGIRTAMFAFDETKILKRSLIRKGGFGRVYPYQEEPASLNWAVKEISATNAQLPQVIEEIMIGFSCRHPNILQNEGFHLEPVGDPYASWWDVYIKVPLMKETLKDKLVREKELGRNLPKEEIKKYFEQIIAGVKYLHARNIAHRDLKPGNILLDIQGNALISDMGQANLVGDESELFIVDGAGTKQYKAPELFEIELTKKDLFKVDIWSLGLTLAEICSMNINIYSIREKKDVILKKHIRDQLEDFYNKFQMEGKELKDADLPLGLRDFEGMLFCNPKERYDIEKVERALNKSSASESRIDEAGLLSTFKESKLNRETPLFPGRFGFVYPYQSDTGEYSWAVEAIIATNKQLPDIIEEIVFGFAYDYPDTIPVQGFYLRPSKETVGKTTQWEVYIKVPRGERSQKVPNLLRSKNHGRATFDFEETKLDRKNMIGKGAFGSVHPYGEGLTHVVKVMSVLNTQLHRVIEKIMIGFSCTHPNVLPVEGFHMEPNGDPDVGVDKWNIYIKMPRMQESLKTKLERHKNSGPDISIEEAIEYILQITAGLKYLHERKIAHRDLKPGNLLLDGNGNVLIADVGQANFTMNESEYSAKKSAETKPYRAPELSEGKKNHLVKEDLFKADIWSLGLIMAEICFIDINRDGTGTEKEEVLMKRIQNRLNDENYNEFPKSDLLGYDPQAGKKKRNEKEVKEIINDQEALKNLKNQARELGQLEKFEDEIKEFRKCFNFDYSKKLISELPNLDTDVYSNLNLFWEGLINSNPKNRFSIQKICDALSRRKAENIFLKEARKMDKARDYLDAIGLEYEDESAMNDPRSFAVAISQLEDALRDGIQIDIPELFNTAMTAAYEKLIPYRMAKQREEDNQQIKKLANKMHEGHQRWFDFYEDEVRQSLEIQGSGTVAVTISKDRGHVGEIKEKPMNNQVTRDMFRSLHKQIAEIDCQNLRTLIFSFNSDRVREKLNEDTLTDLVGDDMEPNSAMNLKIIKIDFTACRKITPEGFKGLFKYIGTYHKGVISLQFIFKQCDGFTNDAAQELGLQIENNLNRIKRLNFCFEDCKALTDEGVIELLKKIGTKNQTLKNLRLNLKHCDNISKDAIREIANQIQKLTNLFSLKFEHDPVEEGILKCLIESIRKLKELRILNLQIKDRKNICITDDTVGILADCFKNNLPRLQILKLIFSGNIKITDLSAQELVRQIGSLNLVNLKLQFKGCEKISNVTIEELTRQLEENLCHCTHFGISFERCVKISSDRIVQLIRKIQEISRSEGFRYHHLALNFSSCGNLDDPSCIEIAQILQETAVEHLVLDVSGLDLEEKTQKCIKKSLKDKYKPSLKLQ